VRRPGSLSPRVLGLKLNRKQNHLVFSKRRRHWGEEERFLSDRPQTPTILHSGSPKIAARQISILGFGHTILVGPTRKRVSFIEGTKNPTGRHHYWRDVQHGLLLDGKEKTASPATLVNDFVMKRKANDALHPETGKAATFSDEFEVRQVSWLARTR